jgi:2-polyprenyl-3-methyl-5-hydroxy-6-metoxy-1,4-benzoquinol methylase
MPRAIEKILEEQKAYYQARANEYDEWFYRKGRYKRGEPHDSDWFREAEEVKAALLAARPDGEILEIAPGTGIWTGLLRDHADSVFAIDSAPEVLQINRAKNGDEKIHYECADIFSWNPGKQFDFIFFSLWLSHVPEEKFESFWRLVDLSLKPDGKWFMIDSRPDEFSRAYDHTITDEKDIAHRKLNDGRSFQVVKRFYDREKLSERLAALGWQNSLSVTNRFFIFGSGTRSR